MMMFPIDFAGMPQGTDVEGMRRWVGEVFENEAFLESRRNIDIKRRRPVQNIRKTIMPAPCLGDDHQSFDLWIYEPINETKDAGTQLRPAVLMFHGGGWIHGNPVGDECE
jgi:acetyl esterase/lipase